MIAQPISATKAPAWLEVPRLAALAALALVDGPESTILDVGCSDGAVLDYVPASTRYWGVDVSQEALQRAARRVGGRRADFIRADIEALPFADERRFDAILIGEVLYYLKQPAVALARV